MDPMPHGAYIRRPGIVLKHLFALFLRSKQGTDPMAVRRVAVEVRGGISRSRSASRIR